MALRDMFNRVKVIIGGMRSDVAPVIADGDPAPLRLNADSELMVSASSTVYSNRVEAFNSAAATAKAVDVAWTETTGTEWWPSGLATHLTIDFTSSVAAPTTLSCQILRRKNSIISTEYITLFLASVSGTGASTTTGGTIGLPTVNGSYSLCSLPIDPSHEYSIQFIKTGAGAVEVLAYLTFSN